MRFLLALIFLPLILMTACADAELPPCRSFGGAGSAPSAGCFTIRDGELLVVQGINGKVSLPGGSAREGETAQCTAHRETWEETGLDLKIGRRLAVFDTGFHLYLCEHDVPAGEIDPPPRMEVRQAFYLAPSAFDQWEWRFPEQRSLMEDLVQGLTAAE